MFSTFVQQICCVIMQWSLIIVWISEWIQNYTEFIIQNFSGREFSSCSVKNGNESSFFCDERRDPDKALQGPMSPVSHNRDVSDWISCPQVVISYNRPPLLVIIATNFDISYFSDIAILFPVVDDLEHCFSIFRLSGATRMTECRDGPFIQPVFQTRIENFYFAGIKWMCLRTFQA